MFSSIAEGESVIENYLTGEDCVNTAKAFQSMGVGMEFCGNTLKIRGAGAKGLKKPAGPIDAGNSGTTVRLISGILAGQDFSAEITGDASLSKRPMKRVIEPLSNMGAKFSAREGNYLPMTITGSNELRPARYNSPVASAQVKSCVLLAGLYAKGDTTVSEPAKSRDHTERMLKAYGADLVVDGLSVTVKGPASLKARKLRVPGDISSAAFFIVAGCLASPKGITLKETGVNPTRDGIIEALKAMGADIELNNVKDVSGEPVADITVRKSALKGADIGGSLIPRLIDELPIIALAATQAEGRTVISGAKELRVKESDRIKTVSEALRKLGAKVEEKEDGMVIKGPSKLAFAEIDSRGDHRLAMMTVVAGLIAGGGAKALNVDCVATSYPDFAGDMKKIGAIIED